MERKSFWYSIGVILVSAIFFNGMLRKVFFKYIAGPVIADAQGVNSMVYRGYEVFSGYNVVNELVYASILASVLFLLYREVGDRGFSFKQMYSFSLFAVLGGVMRVLEDSGVVPYPYNILVISPVGYLLVILVGYLVFRVSLRFERPYVFVAGTGLTGITVCAAPLVYYGFRNGVSKMATELLSVTIMVLGGVFIVQKGLTIFFEGSLLDTVSGYLVSLGHGLDGISSAFSIAVMGYGEKHPLSEWVMNVSGTPYGFTIFKIALVLVFMAFLDGEMDDSDRLLVLGVIVVGLGPGVRNTLRAVLGV